MYICALHLDVLLVERIRFNRVTNATTLVIVVIGHHQRQLTISALIAFISTSRVKIARYQVQVSSRNRQCAINLLNIQLILNSIIN